MNARANPPRAGDSSSEDSADIDQMHLAALAGVLRIDRELPAIAAPAQGVILEENRVGSRGFPATS